MIKITDFAKQQGVTPRGARKLLQTYEKELDGHFERRGQNGTWIDDTAQEFLRSKMIQNPVTIYDEKALPFYEELKKEQAENRELREKLTKAFEQLAKAKDEQLQTQLQLAEKVAEQKFLEAGKEQAEKQAIALRQRNVEIEVALTKAEEDNKTLSDIAEMNVQEAAEAKKEAEDLRCELDRLKNRGFFARLFNRE